MSRVEESVEAGARAMRAADEFGEQGMPAWGDALDEFRELWIHDSRVTLAAAWPILTAGLREMHWDAGPSQGFFSPGDGGYGERSHCCGTCGTHGEYGVEYPCPTVRELDRIDRELGIGGEP